MLIKSSGPFLPLKRIYVEFSSQPTCVYSRLPCRTSSCYNCQKQRSFQINKKTTTLLGGCFKCWHLPIVPGRYQPSIVGTSELNFCVRDGNRWTLTVINTNYSIFPRFREHDPRFYQESCGDPCGNRRVLSHTFGSRSSASPLFAESLPPAAFLFAKTLSGSIPIN